MTNFTDWNVYIPRDEAQELEPQIQNLIESGEIYGPNVTELPNAYNDRHLYQPLLADYQRQRFVANHTACS